MKKNSNDANIINKLLAMQSNSCSHVISKYPHIPSKETSGILYTFSRESEMQIHISNPQIYT
jgi:hypothetical protein